MSLRGTVSPDDADDSQAIFGLGIEETDVVTALPAGSPANVPLTNPGVQDVIDALVLLGLVEQSD